MPFPRDRERQPPFGRTVRRKRVVLEIDGIPLEAERVPGPGEGVVRFADRVEARVRVLQGGARPLVLVDGRVLALGLLPRGDGFEVHRDGRVHAVRLANAARDHAVRSSRGPTRRKEGRVVAPMPGRIVSVNVAPGDSVAAGATLLVIEAMKMQNQIVSPCAGSVRRVLVAGGQSVDRGALLIEIV